MRITQQTIATLVVLTFIISPAMAALNSIANPANDEYGFEGVASGTSISSIGGSDWSMVRADATVQVGDGAGGSAADGLNSAAVTVNATAGSGSQLHLNHPAAILPGHTSRLSFAFQAPTGNGDYETELRLESESPDSFRAIWIILDNGDVKVRKGGDIKIPGQYASGEWYQLVVDKPAWADGLTANAANTFDVSLYDTGNNGQLLGTVTHQLGADIANFGRAQFTLAAYSADLMTNNIFELDHFSYIWDDAGNALPGFTPLGFRNIPEPATVSLLGFSGIALLRRRRA